jgi:SAM-dependent methyltransferase
VIETLDDTGYLRTEDGRLLHLEVGRWLGPADAVDHVLLDRAVEPVLDVGCGPGRHVRALRERRMVALGLDISSTAVALARRNGAPVLQRSVFDALPHCGRWRSALLLDGSIGIGGDPVTLLQRVGEVLAGQGRVLVEMFAPGIRTESLRVAVVRTPAPEAGLPAHGPWFPWARVSVSDIAAVAADAGYGLSETWEDSGRWFAQLDRRGPALRSGRSAGRAGSPGR